MTETPSIVKPSSAWPYVIAAMFICAAGVALVFGVLYLRPQVDPLLLLSAIGALATVLYMQAANFIKSQETHATVNSSSTEKIALAEASAHARGEIEGAAKEQARVAELALVAAATQSTAPTPILNGVQIVTPAKPVADALTSPTEAKKAGKLKPTKGTK